MIFDFDSVKNDANRMKHGVPLIYGARIFGDREVAIVPTIRIGDEEERLKAIGLIDGKLWTAIHVLRGEVVRLISVRRSNAREQREYHSDPG